MTPLQITAAAATGIRPASRNKSSSAAGGNADGAVQPLPPVLAMPTTSSAQGKVAAAANGRVRNRVSKDKDRNHQTSSKKPRQKAAGKQRAVAPGAGDNQPNTDVQSNNLQIVPVLPPPPSNGRKRKQSVSAAASASGTRCNVVARRSSTSAVPSAKKHTILTWLIDAGFLSDREKVFYVPGDGGADKVVTGVVTRTGVHCSCCDAVVPLPVFAAHAGRDPRQRPWEKLLVVSGNSLLRCMQEAWEKERVKTFQSQQKLRAAMEQEQEKSSLARRRLLAKERKGVLERIVSPKMKVRTGEKDSSDDACGVCADGGELLCCDSCPCTFHPECLGIKVFELICFFLCFFRIIMFLNTSKIMFLNSLTLPFFWETLMLPLEFRFRRARGCATTVDACCVWQTMIMAFPHANDAVASVSISPLIWYL
jgi:hypothetical protein